MLCESALWKFWQTHKSLAKFLIGLQKVQQSLHTYLNLLPCFFFFISHTPSHFVKASDTLRLGPFTSQSNSKESILSIARISRGVSHRACGILTWVVYSISDMARTRGGHTDASLTRDSTSQAPEASSIPPFEGGVPSSPPQCRYETWRPPTIPWEFSMPHSG